MVVAVFLQESVALVVHIEADHAIASTVSQQQDRVVERNHVLDFHAYIHPFPECEASQIGDFRLIASDVDFGLKQSILCGGKPKR